MISVNNSNNAALLILKTGQEKTTFEPDYFLGPSNISSGVILKAVNSAFAESKDLQNQFHAKVEELTKQYKLDTGEEPDPASMKRGALVHVIEDNRQAFPPEEFVIKTKLEDGSEIESTIRSLVYYSGNLFEKEVAEKKEQYEASIAAEPEPDAAAIKLNALSQVVKTLILDSQDSTLALLGESDADSEENLAKQFLEN